MGARACTRIYLHELGDLLWCLKFYPVIDGDDLLTFILFNRDVTTKEEQRVRRYHRTVVDEDRATLHHRVVDHEFVLEGNLITVNRLWVELYPPILCEKLWRSENMCNNIILCDSFK